MFALVLSVAMRGMEDPAGERDGLRWQVLLRNAALSQVGFGGHSWRLRSAVRDVMRAMSWGVVVSWWPMWVAVQPWVGMSVRVRVVVRVWRRAAVVERANRVHGVDFSSAVVDVHVGRRHVLVRWGPQVTWKRLQGIVPDGSRIRILTPEVTLTQGGDTAAGAAW